MLIGDGVSVHRYGIAFGYRSLRYGVDDIRSAVHLIQAGKPVRPAAFRRHRGTLHFRSVRQQDHSNLIRTDSVLIVCIVPDLPDADCGFLRHMYIGDVPAGIDRTVACHRFLGNDPGQFVSVVVYRYVPEGISPSSFFVRCHRLADRLHSVRVQCDCNLIRTDRVPVVVIIPELFTADSHGFRHMYVGNVHAGRNKVISADSILRNGIDDFPASLSVFQHVRETVCPFSVTVRPDNPPVYPDAVRVQADGYALRPETVLVLSVLPLLFAADRDPFRYVGIGDIVPGNGHGVAFCRFFGYLVGNFRACFIFRHGKAVCPAVRCRYSLSVRFPAVRGQDYRDFLRPESVMVIPVVPVLPAADGHGLRHMRIGNPGPGNSHRIPVHRILGRRVGDFFSARVFRKACKGILPLISLVQDCLFAIHPVSVRVQVKRNGIGPDTVAVIVIIPGFFHGNLSLFRYTPVGNVNNEVFLFSCRCPVGIDRRLVSPLFFGPDLHNTPERFGAVCILFDIRECIFPALGGGYILHRPVLAVLDQDNPDAVRPFAVLVVRVVPDLFAAHGNRIRHMPVGNDKPAVRIPADRLFISGYRFLIHGVFNRVALPVLRHILKGEGPGFLIQVCGRRGCFRTCDRLFIHLFPVCQQDNRDLIRTDTVPVFIVIPDLPAGNRHLFVLVGVDHRQAVNRLCIAVRHFFLVRKVMNFLPLMVFQHACKGMLPSVLLADIRWRSQVQRAEIRRCSQRHGHLFRTDAVRVVPVVPDLGHSDVGAFRFVCVCNNKTVN